MAEEKIRINSLAKDFGAKSKDIVDLLSAHGFSGKSAMTALEPDELSVVFEYYTQNNQVDLTAFFKLYDDKKAEKKKAQDEAEAKRKEELRKAREATNPKKSDPTKKTGQPQQKRSKSDVRVVDTRGTQSIDVSKYDEKFDSFVTEPENVRAGGKTKIKKKNRSDFQQEQSRGDKRRFGDKNKPKQIPKPVQLKIAVPDEISVGELALKMKISAPEVIKKLMTMGVMASVSDVIDYDTAYLLADEFKIKVEKKVVVSLEDRLFGEEKQDSDEELVSRPPVVVVMGHVDHGKTSLLDAIRNTQVTKGEAGGITQAIGAYSVQINGSDITFLDTPGHEAFTAMRARGANMTDIAVLVVAADDGIMPQTIEAINHAKAAGVNIIVAINKIDKPGADIERVKEELTKYDLLPEEWGGDTICVPISALKHQNIDKLLEMIILSAEMMELKANPARQAKGAIVEARLDKGRGAVATVLVQNGTLHVGDIIIAGTTTGKVRQMYDDKGRSVKEAGPSTPVEITGLSEVPDAGDPFQVVSDERLARELCEQRKAEAKEKTFGASKVSLDDLFGRIENGQKTLNIIVKADVHGSAEAVKASLEKLNNEEVSVKVIHSGVGGITESDVMLASASDAFIVGFNVRPDKQALDLAARDKVDIKTYSIIYECIEEIQAAMKGMLAPKFRENVLGRAEVRKIIRVPNVGTIAGSYITDGKVTRSSSIRVIRDGVVIFEDKISSLKRFKDDAREVAQSFECGIGLERFNDLKEGDILEAYVMEEIPR